MAVVQLNDTESRLDFFQERILRTVEHWQNHKAVQNVEVVVLDRKREAILRAIALGLEFKPAWPLVKRLVIAFTPYMERRGYWDAWKGILEQSISVAQSLADVETETTLTALLARLCQRMSQPQEVVKNYRRVIRLVKRSGNRFEEARACSNLGYLYIDGGRWWRSEVLSKHALAIFEELGSDHGQAHTHNHLGVLYTRLNQPPQAEYHLQGACAIWEKNQDLHSLMFGYDNLALLHNSLNQPHDALLYLHKALKLINNTGESTQIGSILNNMAHSYRLDGKMERAKEYAQKAELTFRTYTNSIGLAHVWHNLCLIHLTNREFEEAEHYYRQSLDMYHRINDRNGEMQLRSDFEST